MGKKNKQTDNGDRVLRRKGNSQCMLEEHPKLMLHLSLETMRPKA